MTDAERKAIVLAAGLGTRLRPLTFTTPKPLVKVGGKCLLDWALDQVAAAGIGEAVVNTSYLYEKVETHLAQRQGTPLIHISREEPQPLETGGGIARVLPYFAGHPFVVLNSDTISIDGAVPALERLWDTWEQRDDIDFLMLLHPRDKAVGFYGRGDFLLREDGAIRRPEEGEEAPYVFTGIEIVHPRVFVDYPKGAFSLNLLWNRLKQADGWYDRIAAIVHDGDWLHVGDMQGLEDVERYFRATA